VFFYELNIGMIDYWFPIGVYTSNYSQKDVLKQELSNLISPNVAVADRCDIWPYWHKQHLTNFVDILKIKSQTVTDFLHWVEQETTIFSRQFNSKLNYKISQGWMNTYYREDFQEPHIHTGFDFSAIYYVKVPEYSGKLVFENPLLYHEMRPIKTSIETTLNQTSAVYTPIEGQLIIFRSNIRHGVYPHKNDEPRVSMAFNLTENI